MLEVNRKFPEKSAIVYSVFSRENSPFVIEVLCIFRFEAAAGGPGRVTFQRSYLNLRTSQELDFRLISISQNNLSEIHISRPTP